MKLVVIDGQGGGLGRALIKKIKESTDLSIIAVGTNALATDAMLKAGADYGATGESAFIFNCKSADIILCPLGAAIPYSIMGEISPIMSEALALSAAHKIFIPYSKGCAYIIGLPERSLSELIALALDALKALI